METFVNLEPKKVFDYFYKINQIPRGSGNEEEITDYLIHLGKELGYPTFRDKIGNVVIRRPASDKYRNSPTVTLQGHMDMVCEKTEDSPHDFMTDPIKMRVENGWIVADNTTLGADDGIGVAMGLALLSEEIELPAIELLITRTEETGMDGAIGLESSMISGDVLINIDSEEEGYVTAGCAGGCTCNIKFDLERHEVRDLKYYAVTLDQLRGGHSGMQILEVSTSAIKSMIQVLKSVQEECDCALVDFKSGSKHNAIPNKATVTIAVEDQYEKNLLSALEKAQNQLLDRLLKIEPDIHLSWKRVEKEKSIITKDKSQSLLNLIAMLPHGVYSMMHTGNEVESSDNLAIVQTEEQEAELVLSIRSSNIDKIHEIQKKIVEAAEMVEAKVAFSDGYPAWQFRERSALRDLFINTYQELFGKQMKILVIHAGLECGLFAEKYPDLDMISFGPDIVGAHTVKEALSIQSTQRSYELLKAVIVKYADMNNSVE